MFDNLKEDEKNKIALATYNTYCFFEKSIERQQKQGGVANAYTLTQDDYNFAFMAQELGYSYKAVADYYQISSATVKD